MNKYRYITIVRTAKGFRAVENCWKIPGHYWAIVWKSNVYRLKSEAIDVGRAYAENHNLKFKEE